MVISTICSKSRRRNWRARKKDHLALLHGGRLHVVRLQRASRSSWRRRSPTRGSQDAGRGARRRLHEALLRRARCVQARCRIPPRTGRFTSKSPRKMRRRIIAALKGGKTKVQVGDPKDRVLHQAIVHRAGEQRHGGSRAHRKLHRGGRLPGAARGRCSEMTPERCRRGDGQERAARARRRGFPDRPQVGARWPRSPGAKKYVICNADEGDPGAFMDRSVLESDPHSVLEGMAIAAYAVGADQGFIYVRAEYPLAISAAANRHQAGQTARRAGQRHL